MPRLIVSIVAYKGAHLTIDCLRSLEREVTSLPGCHAYVVDNASPDDSADRVQAAIEANNWGSWATQIRAPKNGGFAYGNNIVIKLALAGDQPADYVVLVNPDTVMREGAFKIMLDFMERNPKIGIAGGRCEDPDTTPQHCSFRFPGVISEMAGYLRLGIIDRIFSKSIASEGIPEQACPVGWVAGAFMMIRKQVFDAIGLMDEGYFLYYEETDFTLRAYRAGWPCWHLPQSRTVHLVGESSGVTKKSSAPARIPAYWFESRRRYFILNHGRGYAALTDCISFVALVIARLRRYVQPHRDPRPPHFVRDFVKHSAIFHGRETLGPRAIR